MHPESSAEARASAGKHFTCHKAIPSRIPDERRAPELSPVRIGTAPTCKIILLVCPTMWDEAELPPIVAASRYCVLPFGTDASKHPERFDALDFIERAVAAGVQARMGNLALRFIQSIGFDNGVFNVEVFYDSVNDAIHIIEVNPRMCPQFADLLEKQFADLLEKVNGVNSYEIALAIAAGVRPRLYKPSPQSNTVSQQALSCGCSRTRR